MDSSERESLKDLARKKYAQAQTDEQKARAWEMTIESHFWRSAEAYGKQHPGFVVYVAHWLEAQKERVGELFEKEVFEILRAKYPCPKSPRIPPGMSYWHSPKGMKITMLSKKMR